MPGACTKPLFNDKRIMTIGNLYLYHTYMETLKLFKFYSPSSMHKLFEFLPRNKSLLLKVPLVKLETTKQNFVFKATKIWNEFKNKVFDNCTPENSGIIGSALRQ